MLLPNQRGLEREIFERRVVREMQEGDAVIGLARLYCYRQGVFKLVDVPATQAKEMQRELTLDDWVVAHTEHV